MKKKMNLASLEVKSFITSVEEEAQNRLKGGATRNPSDCNKCTPPVYPTQRNCPSIPVADCVGTINW